MANNQVDMHEAQQWYENLRKQFSVAGNVYSGNDVYITQQGLEDIATLLHKKKVGRWDDMMNDHQVEQLKTQNNKMNDVAKLMVAWLIRVIESKDLVMPPTELELDKDTYRTVSQILKTLRVEMSEAEKPEETGLEA